MQSDLLTLYCYQRDMDEMENCTVMCERNDSPTPTSSGSEKGTLETSFEDGKPRKKHRRGKHRRKPYAKLSAEEKRKLEVKEAARAARRQASLQGRPAAPWNTTQFIMEDRGTTDVQFPIPRASRTMSMDSFSVSEDGETYDSPEDEIFEHGQFLEQDFESACQEMASERLSRLSKSELVQQCVELEHELTVIQDKTREETNLELSDLKSAVERLKSENSQLLEENSRLKKSLSNHLPLV